MIGADAAPTDDPWLLRTLARDEAAWSASRPELLPHAQRRVLEIMRVIASDAPILLLDEPAAGLSPDERRDFARLMRFLRDGSAARSCWLNTTWILSGGLPTGSACSMPD